MLCDLTKWKKKLEVTSKLSHINGQQTMDQLHNFCQTIGQNQSAMLSHFAQLKLTLLKASINKWQIYDAVSRVGVSAPPFASLILLFPRRLCIPSFFSFSFSTLQ